MSDTDTGENQATEFVAAEETKHVYSVHPEKHAQTVPVHMLQVKG